MFAATSSKLSAWYAPERYKWLDPLPDGAVHECLTGEHPGDYSWDTAGLAADPVTFERYREAELMHARGAMLDALGCLTPELLGKAGFPIAYLVWFKAGAQTFSESGLDYLDNSSLPHAQLILAIRGCQVVLMGTVESYHVKGGPFGEADELLYPGGAFDPLGLGNNPETLAELKVKEIKNSLLVVSSVFGFYVQAVVTGEGPVENWRSHIEDPFSTNGFTTGGDGKITSTLLSYSPSQVSMVTAARSKLSAWYGRERNKWLGPFSAGAVAKCLTGEYPGD